MTDEEFRNTFVAPDRSGAHLDFGVEHAHSWYADWGEGLMKPEVVHQCPPRGSGIMPCCGRTPFEALSDRITLDPELVTCGKEAPSQREAPPLPEADRPYYRWTDLDGVKWECNEYDHGPFCRLCRVVR